MRCACGTRNLRDAMENREFSFLTPRLRFLVTQRSSGIVFTISTITLNHEIFENSARYTNSGEKGARVVLETKQLCIAVFFSVSFSQLVFNEEPSFFGQKRY